MKLKLILILLLLSLSLLSWSQYPTQRIEGKDTVVVMTKLQASEINETFRKNKDSINYYKQEAINTHVKYINIIDSINVKLFITDSTYNNNLKELKKENTKISPTEFLMPITWIAVVIWVLFL
jgi:hypothetical protein